MRQIGFKLATGDVQRRLVSHISEPRSDDFSTPISSRIILGWTCMIVPPLTAIKRTCFPLFFFSCGSRSIADQGDSLVEGNVITIEPGIYVPPDSSFPSHFFNMGIRIEVRDRMFLEFRDRFC